MSFAESQQTRGPRRRRLRQLTRSIVAVPPDSSRQVFCAKFPWNNRPVDIVCYHTTAVISRSVRVRRYRHCDVYKTVYRSIPAFWALDTSYLFASIETVRNSFFLLPSHVWAVQVYDVRVRQSEDFKVGLEKRKSQVSCVDVHNDCLPFKRTKRWIITSTRLVTNRCNHYYYVSAITIVGTHRRSVFVNHPNSPWVNEYNNHLAICKLSGVIKVQKRDWI